MSSLPTPPTPPPSPARPMQPAPRRGRVLPILLTVFLLLSLAGNFIMLLLVFLVGIAGAAGSSSGQVETETLHRGSSDIVAVVPLAGDVDDAMYERVHQFSEYVKADSDIKAIVLQVDSPGGGITSADEIHHMLTRLKSTTPHLKRMVVSMRAQAASGGYYVSMPADKIYAEPTTLTGSIGVIWPAFELTDLMEKVGVTPEIIKSDAADEYKDAGSLFRPFTEQDRDYIRGLVNHAHGKFSAVVDAGRKGKLKKPVAELAIGKIFTADEALDLGLIDEIAYLDEVCDRVAADAGLSNPTIVRLGIRVGLFDVLGASAEGGGPAVQVKLDPKLVDRVANPRMEFRAPSLR